MTKEFLESLGLESDVIKKIFAQNGKDIKKFEETNEQLEADILAAKALAKTAQDELKNQAVIKPEDTEEYKALKAKYDTDLTAEKQKYTDKVTADDAEKTTSTVTSATLKALKEKGFSAKALEEPMFAEMMAAKIKELVPNAKIKDGNITNLDDLTKPFIEGMKGFIGETTVEGTKVVTHGATTGTTAADPFIAGFDGKK